MTIYTKPSARAQRPLDEFTSTFGEALAANIEQTWFDNAGSALRRMNELSDAQKGELVIPDNPAAPIFRMEPDSPMLSRDEAKARVDETGLDITVPDEGIRQRALDIIIERNTEEAKRNMILQSAPQNGWATSAYLLSSFATSIVDPINIAAAFVPVVGEARYTAMLAKAQSRAARIGVRARVGALEGAVGTAALEPFILGASTQDQTDYSMVNSLENIAFGTILGGGLHSIGGAISDSINARLAKETPSAAAPTDVTVTGSRFEPEDIPALLQRQLEADKQLIAKATEQKVIDELIPKAKAELEAQSAVRPKDIGDLKKEQKTISQKLETIDGEYKARAKQFQKEQKLSRKQAEKAARESIAEDKVNLKNRQLEIEQALSTNKESELAKADLNKLQKGILPERYRQEAEKEIAKRMKGFEKKPLSQAVQMTARQQAEAAPFQVRQDALKTAVAQAVSGRDINVEPHFDALSNPEKALNAIKNQPQRQFDPEAAEASFRAQNEIKEFKEDLQYQQKELEADRELAEEVQRQTGFEIGEDLDEANELIERAKRYKAGWEAAALCRLRN